MNTCKYEYLYTYMKYTYMHRHICIHICIYCIYVYMHVYTKYTSSDFLHIPHEMIHVILTCLQCLLCVTDRVSFQSFFRAG